MKAFVGEKQGRSGGFFRTVEFMLSPVGAAFMVLGAVYTFFFVKSISPYWFNPLFTTDDAVQQIFPFHSVFYPQIFKGDLIYEAMKGYLAPLHYWICYLVTYLTGDPVMMGHWVMLIQLLTAGLFIFLCVHRLAGTAPAIFSVIWFLHTRNIIQRLTAGLPRGWSAVILSGYLYFLVSENHRGVLVVILAGCLLNPPATLIIAASYGLYLLWKVMRAESRSSYSRHLKIFLALCPLYLVVTLYVIHRPPEIGEMATLKVASGMPEFARPGGRFPFVPLKDAWDEITTFGVQAFVSRWYKPVWILKHYMHWIIVGLFLVLGLGSRLRKRKVLGSEFGTFILAVFCVYFASRLLAFRLYVPDRHLQFPIGIFLITSLPSGFWRLFHRGDSGPENDTYTSVSWAKAWPSAVSLIALGALVYAGSVSGLRGRANFNTYALKRGGIYRWVKANTPENALIAGHPTHIDGMQLFGMRKAYATTETAHPFYDAYYREIKRRLIVVWRAYYSKDLKELTEILEPEGIDYFVFRRSDFYPWALKKARYFRPFDQLVAELASRDYRDYAYRKLPDKVDLKRYPFMPFKDEQSAVVDIHELRKWLSRKTSAAGGG